MNLWLIQHILGSLHSGRGRKAGQGINICQVNVI